MADEVRGDAQPGDAGGGQPDGAGGVQPDDASGGHGRRAHPADAALLDLERQGGPLHLGSLLVFDRPPDPDAARASGFARFLDLVGGRLHRVPRYRQKLVDPPLGVLGPVWVDDQDFDLSYHVRHAALPAPGTVAQLTEYAARIFSRPLDRDHPLWELYVIEGLEEGRFALLTKTHQVLVDDEVGLDLATVLLDIEGAPPRPEPTGEEPWRPRPTPSGMDLTRDVLRDVATSPTALLHAGRGLVAAPTRTALRALQVGRGVAALARANLARPAPRSLFDRTPGRHRRLAVQRLPLGDARRVKDVFGTTVNDVVLAVVADATGRYLRHHGTRTDGLWLRALAPVSTSDPDATHPFGGRVVSVFVDLPMREMDPVERLRVCHEAMDEVTAPHRTVGAEFLTELGDFAPPTLHAAAARLAARGRLFNFVVTNAPGPQVPVYCLGARLLGAFPFAPLAGDHVYAIGVTSIDGSLNVGITADHFALPDVELVTGYLVDALAELVRSADAAGTRAELARRGRPSGASAGSPDAPVDQASPES